MEVEECFVKKKKKLTSTKNRGPGGENVYSACKCLPSLHCNRLYIFCGAYLKNACHEKQQRWNTFVAVSPCFSSPPPLVNSPDLGGLDADEYQRASPKT